MLRPGNVHGAKGRREFLEPIAARCERTGVRRYFRADAAFASPEVYEHLEEHGFLYAIRLPANEVLHQKIDFLQMAVGPRLRRVAKLFTSPPEGGQMVFIGKGDRKPPKQIDMENSGLWM